MKNELKKKRNKKFQICKFISKTKDTDIDDKNLNKEKE